jgi:hypothetical protein
MLARAMFGLYLGGAVAGLLYFCALGLLHR